MSLVFSDTTNFKGIVQIYEKEAGFNRGDISGDSDKLKELTADVNLTLDDFLTRAFKAGGTWQFDDSNHEKYPEITTNLVSGQRDYTFTVDGEGNLILEIFKVYVKNVNGVYQEMRPVDKQTPDSNNYNTDNFNDGQDTTGVPQAYDKTGYSISFDLVPNYSSTAGVKILINREASYFVSTDTTKKPGVPGLFHRYFAVKPAFDHARRNTLTTTVSLQNEVLLIERDIDEYFQLRAKDVPHRMVPNYQDNR